MANKKQTKTLHFMKYLSIALVIITILMLGLIFFINLLPLQYFIVLTIIFIIIDFILIKLLLAKRIFKNVLGSLLTIIIIIFMVLGINYELNTIDFFKQFGFNSYKTENYNIAVLKSSNYKELEDLSNKSIGRLSTKNRLGLAEAYKKLDKKITFKVVEMEDISDLTNSLTSNKVSAIILEDTQLEILSEENYDLYESLEIIYKIEVEIQIKEIGDEVDITKEPFNIYLSGIDTYGSITKVSRSDVNIIITVNPNTNEILLTSIPRDYYVTLRDINEKDKLTHAGIYGIETSVGTIEDLLDTKINYYAKVNFTSLIKVVDSLGGVSVDSAYSFTSIDGYRFKKGINNLNGKQALSFSRERKAFAEGDRIRGENQERVLTAIINKAMSPTIITKYNDLLDALKGNFITNLDTSEITNFIKGQINNPSNWSITSISLDGSDAYDYTYSYKKSKSYVMNPYLESINNAKTQISSVLNK